MNKENMAETKELEVQTEKESDDGTVSEYIKIGDELYPVAIRMDCDTIYINPTGMDITEAIALFVPLTSIEVADEGGKVYGIYPRTRCIYAGVDVQTGEVSVTMHLVDSTEARIEELEKTQAEQDDVIAELAYGEGV